MMQSYTREEFYELVWSKPMVQLAPEFNLSDVALHKLCRKIPVWSFAKFFCELSL